MRIKKHLIAKIYILLLCLFPCAGQAFAESRMAHFSIAADVAYTDPFISKLVYNHVCATVNLDKNFSLRVPLVYAISLDDRDVSLLSSGVQLDYYPFQLPLFISLSMVDVAYLFGIDAPLERLQYLDEVAIGYHWDISDGFFVEPAVVLFDPSGVYADAYEAVTESFGDFPKIRFELHIGFNLFDFPEERKQ
ncbi:MAG: hypothetical protein LKE40_14205 [Spirochaetia bacterium]|jgi:hypothetical protein|nr:hypothetical protein [Spirochaetia bacterium]